jgi:hypothetical protein
MCCGNNGSVASYNGYIPGPSQVLSHADCEGVTIDLLNMWLRLIICVETNSLYTSVSITPDEVNSAKSLLATWIAAKEIDPASCDHQEKMPLIQALINKIVAFGQC